MRALDRLMQLKGQFGREAARRTAALLARLAHVRLRAPADLLRLHETALFLRAFPQSPRVARLADRILFSFADRMRGADPAWFDDVEISGIAGTSVSTSYSYHFARSLVHRHGRSIEVDWENYANPDRLGGVLGQFAPLAYEEYAVEPHVHSQAWFENAGLNLRGVLEKTDPRVYDLLEMPLRWNPDDSSGSRSRLRLPAKATFHDIFCHQGPLLKRSAVSIEAEFAAPPIPAKLVGRRRAQTILGVIVDASATRYRELYGFQHPDEKRVYHADLGRGVDLYFFGVPPEHRLPLRAYHAGMFFKNGVPMGYVEGLSLAERMEIGFNLFYTFRDGETAWVYARILKLLREQLGVTCFSVDPYQLGHENEEAIASGAFWFYRKLGFRPASDETARIAAREEAKIAAKPGYRTSPAILRKLAVAPVVFGDGADWDGFSVYRMGVELPGLGRDAARAKRAAEEVDYLRLLQSRPDLRRKIIRWGQQGSRGRDAGYPAPPAQIRACAPNAHGSYLGCLA
jgi:hypothetical protein